MKDKERKTTDAAASDASFTITDGRRVARGTATPRQSRRNFMKRSSALLVATGAAVASAQAYADCDGQAGQYKRCSDSDSGENSDPRGCGRCGRTENVPSSQSWSGARSGGLQSQHEDIEIDQIQLPLNEDPVS